MLLKYKKFLYSTFFIASMANAQSYLPVEEDKKIKVITPDLTQTFTFNYDKVKLLKSRYSDFRDSNLKLLKDYNSENVILSLKKQVGLPANAFKVEFSENEALETLGKYLEVLSVASTYDQDLRSRLNLLVASLAEIHRKKSDFNLSFGNEKNWNAISTLMNGLLNVYAYTHNKAALHLHLDILSQLLKTRNIANTSNIATLDLLLLHSYAFTGNSEYLKHLSPKAFEGASLIDKEIELLAYLKQYQWVNGEILAEEIEKWYSELLALRPLSETNESKVNLWLALAKNLHALSPNSSGMDFYENVLLNYTLNSVNAKNGSLLIRDANLNKKNYSASGTRFSSNSVFDFISSIYSKGLDGSLFVNLYVPSEINFNGFKIRQTGDLPINNRVEFSIEAPRPKSGMFKFRKPEWARNVYVSINGVKQKDFPEKDGYIVIHRQWKGLERVSINLESDFSFKNLDENRNQVYFGPMALVADFGSKGRLNETHAFVTEEKDANKLLRRVTPTILMFESINNSTLPRRINFKPLIEITDEEFQLDIEKFTPLEWSKKD